MTEQAVEVDYIQVVDHEDFMGINWRPINIRADDSDDAVVNFEIEGDDERILLDEFKAYASGYITRALTAWAHSQSGNDSDKEE